MWAILAEPPAPGPGRAGHRRVASVPGRLRDVAGSTDRDRLRDTLPQRPGQGDYPEHWEADVVLRDGRTAHLRPIEGEDEERFVAFYETVSEQSKYLRFFSSRPRLSAKDVEHFTHVDHDKRVCFVMTLADRIIGVGRYETVKPGDAEVAFLVSDEHHGRGIGQLLLEHLAQAGRERGVQRFSAEVLPENARMLRVFREAGYKVAGGYDDGLVTVEFPIDPTETAIGVMLDREHRSESSSIRAFLNARSVAVVGASRRQQTVGQALVRNLVQSDFQGRVFVVNPAAEAVSGVPAYPTVTDIPHDVDVAVVAVPADAVADVVLDCAAKGVHGLVVVSAGFAETGEEGRKRQRRLVGLARSYGLRLIGPNALGVINTAADSRMNASLSPLLPDRGRVGFFCQSGALGTAILEKVQRRGLGLSTFVSAGNRADVSGNDLLQYWDEDDHTEVVLLYLESIGNPRKFSRIARRVSRRKPIVAVRSGRATQGVPMGHAVRTLSAPGAAVDAMFRQAGVIQVDTLDEMFDVAQLLAHQPLPRGERVAIVGNSDALGLLAADAAVSVGLQVTRNGLLGADATAEDFELALDAAIDDDEVDAVVAVYVSALTTVGDEVADVLAAVGEQSDKPLVSTFLGTEGVPELLRIPDVGRGLAGRGSVPSYPAVEAAVRALAEVVSYAAWLRETEDDPEPGTQVAAEAAGTDETDEEERDDAVEVGRPPAMEDAPDVRGAQRLVAQLLIDHPEGHDLSGDELRELLECYEVELWPARPVGSVQEACEAADQLGWPVVLKATTERLRQTPDASHVRRDIEDRDELAAAWKTLLEALDSPDDPAFVVQRGARHGVPVSMAATEDPLFGPVLSFGISGPLTDLLGDRVYRIPPMTERDAAAMVREIKAAPLLHGYRGSETVDLSSVERLLLRIAQLKNDVPEVRHLDLSLVLVSTLGAAVLTAHGRVEEVPDHRAEWFARRLSSMPGDALDGVEQRG
ncbi:GNAT family N-acetyltransferase [Nocardioidaceae bacterium]|nr:GNAT family N-acetyltransferase [Nocardioidaceae bacterium]